MSETRTKSMIGGMTVLGIAGVLCKLIGVLFNIPLTHLIGADGLGIFYGVFPTYNLLLTVSSAGLPVAISRMVSHCLARENPRGAKQVFQIAAYMMTAIGCVFSILMFAFSRTLAAHISQPEAMPGFQMISPCVAIVCLLGAFRGFMQGQQNMVPTAVSQLMEQVLKVFIALPLAYLGNKISVAMGAAYTLLGISIVEGITLIYMIILYIRKKSAFDAIEQGSLDRPVSRGSTAVQLLVISIPITLSACIVPLASFVDSAMLVNRMMVSGLELEEARPLYGLYSGTVIRLINIPTALALSISMSLVPAISGARAVHNEEMVRSQTDLGLRFAFLIGLPCSIGMSLLAEPIIAFFYSGALTQDQITETASLLTVSSLTVVFFTVVQATSAILQGVQKQRIPMYTLIAGVACKIGLNYLLVGTPGIHIHGAPIASIVCYTVSMLPNLYFVIRNTGVRINLSGWVLRPGLATLCMGLVVYPMVRFLPVSHLCTILEVAVGVGVYLAAALFFKAITRQDLAAFKRTRRKGAAK